MLIGERDGQYWVLDAVRRQASPLDVERLLAQTAERDGRGIRIAIEQEGGAAGALTIDRLVRQVLRGYSAIGRRPFGDKVAKAQLAAAACEAGNDRLLRDAWNEAFVSELELLPDPGSHDDMVDGLSGAINELAGVQTAKVAVRRPGRVVGIAWG